MNIERTSSEAHPALAVRAEAAAWLARLRGPNRSSEVESGFRRWLGADGEHSRAFELLSERLEVVERLKTRPLPRHWRPQHKARTGWRTPLLSMAATLALVAVGVFVYERNAGVATDIGEQRTLTLADGTRVYLNTDTRVRVRYDDLSRRVELVSGEALFEVAKNSARPFVVIAGEQSITALGTTFVVRREARQLSVTLVEGKISVASIGPPAVLSPGERLIVASRKPPRIDEPVLAKVTAWRQGQVALEDMPLGDAVVEMNRYNAVKLSVASPEAEKVRVGGFFRMGDSASFARAVATTYGLEVVEGSESIVIAGRPRAK